MIGVSVLVKGTSTGVVTDVNGNFSLSVPKNSVLSISYIGYKSQEISINGAKKLNIEMEPEAQNLDEVVVVAYGQQKKVSVTGSMSSINNEALLKSPSASLGNAISGKLPGLSTVQYSGLPGADDPVILIRGQSSFNGSSPLILVDGVERSFTQIDLLAAVGHHLDERYFDDAILARIDTGSFQIEKDDRIFQVQFHSFFYCGSPRWVQAVSRRHPARCRKADPGTHVFCYRLSCFVPPDGPAPKFVRPGGRGRLRGRTGAFRETPATERKLRQKRGGPLRCDGSSADFTR